MDTLLPSALSKAAAVIIYSFRIAEDYSFISKHLKGRSVPPVGNGFAINRGFCHFPISRHFTTPPSPLAVRCPPVGNCFAINK